MSATMRSLSSSVLSTSKSVTTAERDIGGSTAQPASLRYPPAPPGGMALRRWRRGQQLGREPPEARRVAAHDLAALLLREIAKQRVDHSPRVRPVVAVVREVGRPCHVVDPHLVADAHPA